MNKTFKIKPNQKPIVDYYAAIDRFRKHHATGELSIRAAFQNMLSECAKMMRWILIPEHKDRALGHIIRPDGTVKDRNSLTRGYWEAKDQSDDLDIEITRKSELGYPLKNTIFENTINAILFQEDREVLRVDLRKKGELIRLLEAFFNHVAPNFDNFELAVEKFKSHIPELAQSLAGEIREAHSTNSNFKEAFNSLFGLCKTSLNKDIRKEAVDEMLVQHILTERIIRSAIGNPFFISENVIAVEIERTIATLSGGYFGRVEFLQNLDQFYNAIEDAARDIHYFNDKLYLLDHVYERFFQGYCVKTADTHGIIYTPQEVVSFICASIEETLLSEFGKDLGDPEVQLLDPATGTGSFIVNILNRTSVSHLDQLYEEQIFANEVMLMPYYIATLNIEHTYFERVGKSKPFSGICYADTLDLTTREPIGKNGRLRFTEENTKRIEKQVQAPITVILGNPPYNAHQINENDNNKNRKYAQLDRHLRDTYVRDSHAQNKNTLYDAYVRFFRWATDRLEGRDGIICFITNNNFIHDYAFDGMRKHLAQDFTDLYHLDLGGNYRKGEGGDNIFGIKPGVGITLAIRNSKRKIGKIFYHRLPKMHNRAEKLDRIASLGMCSNVAWREIKPDKKFTWLAPENEVQFNSLLPMGRADVRQRKLIDAKVIFLNYGNGIKTNRDWTVYDFNRDTLVERVERVIEDFNTLVDKFNHIKDSKKKTVKYIDDFCEKHGHIEWSRDLKNDLKRGKYTEFKEENVRNSLYRPFTGRYLYFDTILNEEVYQFPKFFPTEKCETENRIITVTGIGAESFHTFAADKIVDLKYAAVNNGGNQCFALYTYTPKGKRKDNISGMALKIFREHYGNSKFTREDIFHYVYGILNHPDYRAKFADNLKRSLPHIPFASDFNSFASAGRELMQLHLNYDPVEPYPLKWIETPKVKPNWRVSRMKIVQDAVVVNEWLTLKGLPKEVLEYKLGNRSALEWVVDQYRIKEDKRTGIVSDPNRSDNPQYIARLIEKVVRVSVETVRVIKGLPELVFDQVSTLK